MDQPHKTPVAPLRGYTLIELLLALAVVSAAAAIVWPPLLRMYTDYQVREAGEQVRSALAHGRFQALDEGLVYQFLFEPEGQRYLVIPYETESVATDDQASDTASASAIPSQSGLSRKLPEQMQFGAEESTDELLEPVAQEFISGMAEARDLADVDWSSPILLYPDGTSQDVTIRVNNAKGRAVRITLRGLTGNASVSRVEADEETTP
jgi:prepilin-type N-terminal cleavage/methylation domain-containing protein